MLDQVTFRELIKDPIYKAWIQRKPQLRPVTRTPWRVWVQRKDSGPWAYKDYPTYAQAFNRLVHEMKAGAWDGAVACPGLRSPRPMVVRGTKPLKRDGQLVKDKNGQVVRVPNKLRWVMPEGHLWCPYCRRPTRWGYYERHHALKSLGEMISPEERCRICGCRKSFVRRFHT